MELEAWESLEKRMRKSVCMKAWWCTGRKEGSDLTAGEKAH